MGQSFESLSSHSELISAFGRRLSSEISINNFLTSFIYFNNNDKKFEINSNITDSIILSMKTFTDLCIDSDLLINENKVSQKDIHIIESNPEIHNNYIDNDSNIDVLKLALDKCIKDEKFESAAFLRDRIKVLNRK